MAHKYNVKTSDLDLEDLVPLTPNASHFAISPTKKQRRNESNIAKNGSSRINVHTGSSPSSKTSTLRPQSILSVASYNQAGFKSTTSKADLKRGIIVDSRLTRLKSWMVNEGGRKIFTWTWIAVHLFAFTLAFLNFQVKDDFTHARSTFHITYPIARSSALILHLDVAFILLPICRNLITFLRRSTLNSVIPFEKNITFHKFTGISLSFFSLIHIISHLVNFSFLAKSTETGMIGFMAANFLTGPGATGWIMTLALVIIGYYSRESVRKANFERFWYSHHLFIVFFMAWQLHGMFCMIQPDRPPYCSYHQIGVFWKYWLAGGTAFIIERTLREIRSNHKTYISKVIQHPSRVCEVQIKKEKTMTRAGQYVYLKCPEVSFWQWHPFTLTSAPEEDYISVHIRCVGDFTTNFALALGCQFSNSNESLKESTKTEFGNPNKPTTNRILPRVMIDGPFGSASEDVFKFEAVILCGGGIGVTPFASVLKSIWYKLNLTQKEREKQTRLQKVYFFWVCRDFESCEWFRSLLEAIEEQDLEGRVELHTYITQKLKPDEVDNIIMSGIDGSRDVVTRLKSPTHYGRPNWDRVFNSVRERHPATDVGVFFCGPPSLGHQLHLQCNKWTGGGDDDTRFFWGKENF
ncbi:ferric reductase NAD binding domain-containing protein [Melampsora americana]|nr:ferric reductase NAD binding domain-containing protein [Melampsora americana]